MSVLVNSSRLHPSIVVDVKRTQTQSDSREGLARPRHADWALPVLAVASALGNVGLAAIATSGAVLVVEVTGRETESGLPLGLTTAGAAVAALFTTRLMVVVGRSFALLVGYLIGTVGALGVVVGATRGWSTPVLVGNGLMGGAVTATALTRYAAAAVTEKVRQGRGLSIAVAMGAVGAVAGPNLYEPAGQVVGRLGLAANAGLYALAVPALMLAAGATWAAGVAHPALRRSKRSSDEPTTSQYSIRKAVLSTATLRHVVALATANLVMVGAMSVVPFHMSEGGHGHGAVGAVVSLHLLAMFAPSPLSGRWADRIGAGNVANIGLSVMGTSCLLLAAEPRGGQLLGTSAALALLGLGWNLAFVGGSAALVQSVPTHLSARIEGPVEAVVALCAALGAVGAGLIHTSNGLGAVGYVGAVISVTAVGSQTLAALPARRASWRASLAGSYKTILRRSSQSERSTEA